MIKSAFLTTYDHDGIKLDLYGVRDEDGIYLTSITVHGDKQDISDLFTSAQEQLISERADEQMSRAARQHNVEARAERHQWHKEFAIAA